MCISVKKIVDVIIRSLLLLIVINVKKTVVSTTYNGEMTHRKQQK